MGHKKRPNNASDVRNVKKPSSKKQKRGVGKKQSKAQKANTHCRILERRMGNHILTPLVFDVHGTCISEERAKWSSWCGKVGRTRVDIGLESWKQVTPTFREKLLEECKVNTSTKIVVAPFLL
jgi:hypothetical protein